MDSIGSGGNPEIPVVADEISATKAKWGAAVSFSLGLLIQWIDLPPLAKGIGIALAAGAFITSCVGWACAHLNRRVSTGVFIACFVVTAMGVFGIRWMVRDVGLVATVLHAYRIGGAPGHNVAVLVQIDNKGSKATSARDFKITSKSGAIPSYLTPANITMRFDIAGDRDGVFEMQDFIARRIAIGSIEPGVSMRGWLLFGVQANDDLKGASIEFIEVANQEAISIPLGDVVSVPPAPSSWVGYPDIRFPFQLDSEVNKRFK